MRMIYLSQIPVEIFYSISIIASVQQGRFHCLNFTSAVTTYVPGSIDASIRMPKSTCFSFFEGMVTEAVVGFASNPAGRLSKTVNMPEASE